MPYVHLKTYYAETESPLDKPPPTNQPNRKWGCSPGVHTCLAPGLTPQHCIKQNKTERLYITCKHRSWIPNSKCFPTFTLRRDAVTAYTPVHLLKLSVEDNQRDL